MEYACPTLSAKLNIDTILLSLLYLNVMQSSADEKKPCAGPRMTPTQDITCKMST